LGYNSEVNAADNPRIWGKCRGLILCAPAWRSVYLARERLPSTVSARMDPQLFQRLTSSEFERYLHELELAVENHTRWLAQVNRSLVCGSEPSGDDLAPDADRHCHFGRWLHGLDESTRSQLPHFAEIAEAHRRMHLLAGELLRRRQVGASIFEAEYDPFIAEIERMRSNILNLRNELKQSVSLVSRLMGNVFANASEGVLITDPDGVILNVNRAFSEVTGYSAEEVRGKTPSILHSGRQGEKFYHTMWESLQRNGQWQGEIWNRRKSGEVYPEWLSISSVRDDNGALSHYVAIFSDITSAKENEKRLHRLAHYDSLTDLPNRILFTDRVKSAIVRARRSGKRLAVMFLDLDGFKPVNDLFGHAAGDRLLQRISARLVETLRESDTVARFGGDEFTILLNELDRPEDAAAVAEKVITAVAHPCPLDNHEVFVTTSIGIALFPEDGDEPDVLVGRADAAMYESKKRGKNGYTIFNRSLR